MYVSEHKKVTHNVKPHATKESIALMRGVPSSLGEARGDLRSVQGMTLCK